MAGRKKRTEGAEPKIQKLDQHGLAALCCEWSDLDEARLELDRQSAAKKKLQDAIERQLVEQLHAAGALKKRAGDYEFGFELVPGTLYYKEELIRAIGVEEFERRVSMVPQRNRFYLTVLRQGQASGAKKLSPKGA